MSRAVDHVRAFAKIVGPGWDYYMTKPKIILGRGGKGIDCDVIISTEKAVSRQHLTIRFAPELQAFEVENLSKNGILVNGEFVHKLAPPVLLRSQADIAFGRMDPMRISFLLPLGNKTSSKKKELAADRNVPLLQWIGEAIISKHFLTAAEIRDRIELDHPHKLEQIGSEQIIASSIRHILTQNQHIFTVMDSMELENGTGPIIVPDVEGGRVKDAYFAVREEHKSRFHHLLSEEERTEQGVGQKHTGFPPVPKKNS